MILSRAHFFCIFPWLTHPPKNCYFYNNSKGLIRPTHICIDDPGGFMNKSELIEVIAQKTGMTKKRAEDVVNLVFDSMTDALSQGERIEIRGFGSFVNRSYGAYTGRNPRTSESIQVKPKRLPFF